MEEVFNFSQEDVEEDDVMLLDTHDSIFIWVGREANVTEKKEAMQTAIVSEHMAACTLVMYYTSLLQLSVLFFSYKSIFCFIIVFIIY